MINVNNINSPRICRYDINRRLSFSKMAHLSRTNALSMVEKIIICILHTVESIMISVSSNIISDPSFSIREWFLNRYFGCTEEKKLFLKINSRTSVLDMLF